MIVSGPGSLAAAPPKAGSISQPNLLPAPSAPLMLEAPPQSAVSTANGALILSGSGPPTAPPLEASIVPAAVPAPVLIALPVESKGELISLV